MSKNSNQKIERYYFEMFRKDYPLPVGIICYGDRPDVILESTNTIGIEITNFYLEEGKLPQSEQVQRKVREKVVSEAQRLYQAQNGKKIELTFGFDKANPIRNQQELVKKIFGLVKHVEEWETGEIRKDVFQGIPEISFTYLNAKGYEDAKWRVVQVYRVPIMSIERLKEIIKAKEAQSKNYKKCDAYWLLVVVDFINAAQDQEIRVDDFEKIESEIFEKIIIYKTIFGYVFEAK